MKMTETAHKRDFVDLATLLAMERDAYGLLLSICSGQHAAFSRGGVRTLVKVMARKQAVIDAIGRLEERLSPYTTRWQTTLAALPAMARREIQALVDEIGALLGQVLENENLIAKAVSGERDKKAARIRDIGPARTAVRAYEGTLAGSGRFLDRES
jgi:hypothetical protein